MLLRQRLDDVVEAACDDFVELVQGEPDAVVCHPALGEVVGPNPLGTVAAAHQGAARLRLLGGLPGLRGVQELGVQQLHRARPVLQLRAFVLAFDHDARGEVGEAHRRFGLVDVLAAGP